MPAFTEMAEMFIMKTKNSEKRALFSIKCSRGELEKHQEKEKTTSVDEKEKDEVKLHAALVLKLLSGQFTNLEGIAQWMWQGFQRQRELNYFSLPATRREKSLCIEAKLRRNYN